MSVKFLKYVSKRLLLGIFTFILVVTITFWVMQMVPGGPWLSEKSLSPEVIAQRTAMYGLDKPLFIQYLSYIGKAFTFNFGESLKFNGQLVTDRIFNAFKVSLLLGVIAAAIALVFGTLFGTYAATHQNKLFDRVIMFITTASVAMPTFVISLILLYLFAVTWKILPTSFASGGAAAYVLPIFAEALYPTAYITRLVRSSTLDVVGQDYMRTAKAKGLAPSKILMKHGVRNSITPVITYFGPMFAFIITGSLVIDQVFQIPGSGRVFQQAINGRDYPVIMGMTCLLSLILIVLTLVSDILYKVANPRVDFD
ncbi:MAG: ABC transporter permease [Bacilli bacterium]|nr:ABC transporter permease [Bacilli bacterium]